MIEAVSHGTVREREAEVRRMIGLDPASVNEIGTYGYTPLMYAVCNGHASIVKLLLQANAETNLANDGQETALHRAAGFTHASQTDIIQQLLVANADPSLQDVDGRTPLERAKVARIAIAVRALGDLNWIEREAAEELRKFESADVVHVLSVRFGFDLGSGWDFENSLDPCDSARWFKEMVETASNGRIKVWNPNSDNALISAGDDEHANSRWLVMWRHMLVLASQKQGRLVQLVSRPGLSPMQEAESDMASDKGVPVIRVDLQVFGRGTAQVREALVDRFSQVLEYAHGQREREPVNERRIPVWDIMNV